MRSTCRLGFALLMFGLVFGLSGCQWSGCGDDDDCAPSYVLVDGGGQLIANMVLAGTQTIVVQVRSRDDLPDELYVSNPSLLSIDGAMPRFVATALAVGSVRVLGHPIEVVGSANAIFEIPPTAKPGMPFDVLVTLATSDRYQRINDESLGVSVTGGEVERHDWDRYTVTPSPGVTAVVLAASSANVPLVTATVPVE